MTYQNKTNEIQAVVRSLTVTKTPGPEGFTVELYQMYKEGLMLMLLKLSRKTQREKNTTKIIPQRHCYSDTKAGARHKKERAKSIFLMNTDKTKLTKDLPN